MSNLPNGQVSLSPAINSNGRMSKLRSLNIGKVLKSPKRTEHMGIEILHDPETPQISPESMQDITTFTSKPLMDTTNIQGENKENGGGTDSWATMQGRLKDIDEKMVKNWNDEIDTLLVFAGLFSAVLTAFNIESYRKLSTDSSDIALLVLAHMSQQISSFTITNGFLNSTVTPFNIQKPSQPPVALIRINVLWFSSLVLSLISASLGMLAKQWLREYLAGDHTSSKQRVCVRQFRYEGLLEWRIHEIMALLPTLLQISLILFLIGLVEFLGQVVHPTVATVVTVIVGIWLFAYAASVVHDLYLRFRREPSWKDRFPCRYVSWERTETPKVKESNKSLEMRAIITADATLADDDLLNSVIRPCMSDLDGSSILFCIRNILNNRHQIPAFLDAGSANLSRLAEKAAITIISILLDALDGTKNPITWSLVDKTWVVEALSYVRNIMSVTRKRRLVVTDPNGTVSDVDTTVSSVLQKSLAMGDQEVITEALSILSLRREHHDVKLPTELSQFMPKVILSAHFLVDTWRTSKINPLSVICVVLGLANQMPSDRLHADTLATFIVHARRYFHQLTPSHKRYIQQCGELARKLNERVSGINDLLRDLQLIEKS